MKKLAIATLVALSVSAYAGDTVTVEGQRINNAGAAAQQQYVLGIKKDFSKFAGATVSGQLDCMLALLLVKNIAIQPTSTTTQ
jgi:hypothetical protein